MPSIVKRRMTARLTLRYFQNRERTDDCDAVTDLLANLMHLTAHDSARWGTFEDALRKAHSHYFAETGGNATRYAADIVPACAGSPVPDDDESDGEHAFNSNGVCIACGVKDKRG